MDKYIRFKGPMSPRDPLKATDEVLKDLINQKMIQGIDYDIVPLKLVELQDKNKKFFTT